MDKNMEIVDKRVEWLHCDQSSAASGIFGEPEITTPIGDAYQAQISPLMTENERLQLIALPVYHDAMTDVENHFDFGLPIPVTWVETMESAECKSGTGSDLLPVPCLSGEESWSEIEHESFVLGLYIFGKKLPVVSKFVGDKAVSNGLSYYYGVFFRSIDYQKWTMYRKNKIRKSDPGKKIFKSWRRQELFSRLLPVLSDECKTHLTEVSSTFDEGSISFERYVLSLRDIVGINLLVEAVAIGKEERDLATTTKYQISKKRHTTCSALTTQEIVDLLKGRIGLSNERLSDVFWDAVWPRLLATGWHSEQTPNYTSKKSKYSLVFLAPGVEKFSRRSLEKGSQYFNSCIEVLNKVALEPQLLRYEADCDTLVEPQVKQRSANKENLFKYSTADSSLVEVVNLTELSSFSVSRAAGMQLSCCVSIETDHDVNHNNAEIQRVVDHLDPLVARIEDKKMDISTNVQHVRKLELASKQIVKRQRGTDTRNGNKSGEDEVNGDSRSEKKSRVIVLGFKSPRWAPVCATKESVSYENAANQADLSSSGGGNGQIIRQSTRNRLLSTKALEAIANGFMDQKKKRKGSE